MPDKTTPQIERAARAICQSETGDPNVGIPGSDCDIECLWDGHDGRCPYLKAATAALSTTLEPSEEEIEAAAIAECNIETGGVADVWESPMTDREYRKKKMRAALIASARVRVGE